MKLDNSNCDGPFGIRGAVVNANQIGITYGKFKERAAHN